MQLPCLFFVWLYDMTDICLLNETGLIYCQSILSRTRTGWSILVRLTSATIWTSDRPCSVLRGMASNIFSPFQIVKLIKMKDRQCSLHEPNSVYAGRWWRLFESWKTKSYKDEQFSSVSRIKQKSKCNCPACLCLCLYIILIQLFLKNDRRSDRLR